MTRQEEIKRQASMAALRAMESLDKETTRFYNRIGDVNADVVRDMIEVDDANTVIFKLVKNTEQFLSRIDEFKYRLEEQIESLKDFIDYALTLRNELLENEENDAEDEDEDDGESDDEDDEYSGPIVYSESYRI